MKSYNVVGVIGTDTRSGRFKKFLDEAQGDDIHLLIDSVGGSVFDGFRIYNAIRDYSGKVTVQLGAVAASIASYIPLAVDKENITVSANTSMLLHKAWSLAIGNADEMKQEAEILSGFDQILANRYSEVSGRDADSLLEEMGKEYWIIGGQNIVAAGFAGQVIDGGKESKDSEKIEKPKDKAEIMARIEESKILLKQSDQTENLGEWAAQIAAVKVKREQDPQPKPKAQRHALADMKARDSLDKTCLAFLCKYPGADSETLEEMRVEIMKEAAPAIEKERERCLSLMKSGAPQNLIIRGILDGATAAEIKYIGRAR